MVQSSLSSHIDRNEHQRPIDESGWETTLRVVASLGSMASGWAVHGLGVLGYQWSVTPRPIAGQWSPATTFSAYWNLRKEAATHPALRYGAFSAAGLWAGAVKAISHMFLQEYVFAPLLHIATSDDEELDESFEAYDPIAPIKQGDMYQRGGWTGPVCAMASAAGAILMSLPFLKAKFLLRTQSRRPDGSFKYTGLFQSIGVIWREQRWGLITNNLSAFISFGILYDVVGFLTDRYKLSTLIMKIKTREGVLHNLKHALALAIDDIIEAAIIVAFTMPVNVVLRRLEAQAGGVAPFSADGVVYAGFLDCVQQIFVREGLNGFYKGAMPELLERLLPRVLVDAAVDLGLNSFFGVPATYDSTAEHSHAD